MPGEMITKFIKNLAASFLPPRRFQKHIEWQSEFLFIWEKPRLSRTLLLEPLPKLETQSKDPFLSFHKRAFRSYCPIKEWNRL